MWTTGTTPQEYTAFLDKLLRDISCGDPPRLRDDAQIEWGGHRPAKSDEDEEDGGGGEMGGLYEYEKAVGEASMPDEVRVCRGACVPRRVCADACP